MFADKRDGDLPPGVYERMPDGTLVLTKKILTNDPPRYVNVALDGTITNVTHNDMDFLNEEVLKHYEAFTGHSLTAKKGILQDFKDMCNRAAEYVMEKK
jgi:hypothetical protein